MTTPRYRLVLGSKAWSSWSFRPWLLMHEFALPFEEVVIPLRTPDTARDIAQYTASGKIPVLIDHAFGSAGNGLTIWDTLAIIEHLAEQHANVPVWPREPVARSIARSISAEMHAGFAPLRQNCPMDFNARGLAPVDATLIPPDVRRIVAVWRDCRRQFGGEGPFLFGAFSAADAMYAPVVSRFATYGIDPSSYGDDGSAAAYMHAVMALGGWQVWSEAAAQELPG